MPRSLFSSIEPLEARIAPAAVLHSPPNIVAAGGKTGATVDLGNMFDVNGTFHTLVTFHTNFDSDPNTPGIQGDITIELFDDTAPLTVQNFLAYATNPRTGAGFINTFFHRLAVPDATTGSTLDILQGGGYATNFAHINTLPPVHNEFGVSNTVGTVALAKASGNANSGTSEFFINLADNSSNLDAQNGGFTVFGKLVPNAVDDSLTVAQKIGQATISNLTPGSSSALNTVPTQTGYDATTGKLPTAAQLFTITSVDVKAPLNGNSPGAKFTVSSSNPTLVIPTLAGDLLKLSYRAGLAGVSTITVNATSADGETTVKTFNVTVMPNLISSSTDSFAGVVVPGDVGTGTVKVVNTGAGVLKEKVDITAFLFDLGQTDSSGNVVSENLAPQQIGILKNVALNVAGGGSVSVVERLNLPTSLEVKPGENYRIGFQITAADGTTLQELYTDDESSATPVVHARYNAFGNFGGRVNVPLKYTDTDNRLVTMTASGGGYGQLFYESGDATKPLDLGLYNTSGATNMLATVAGGHTKLGNVFVSQPQDTTGVPTTAAHRAMGVVNLAAVDLTGDFVAGGGVRGLSLGNLKSTDSTTHYVDIGLFADAPNVVTAISLGTVTDYSLASNEPITALSVLDWRDVNSTAETISSYFLDTFSDKGVLQADMTILGAGTVRAFAVTGGLQSSKVQIGGNVGAVVVGGMTDSSFFAGAFQTPTTLSDFYAARSIASFVVKSGVAGGSAIFANSNVAAANIGTVVMDQVDGTGSTAFGIVADKIARYTHGALVFTNVDTPGTGDVIGSYRVKAL